MSKKLKILLFDDNLFWVKVFGNGKIICEITEGREILDYMQSKIGQYDEMQIIEINYDDLTGFPLTTRFLRYAYELGYDEQRYLEEGRYDLMEKYIEQNKTLPIERWDNGKNKSWRFH